MADCVVAMRLRLLGELHGPSGVVHLRLSLV